MWNLEADGPQQQKTTLLSAENRKARLRFTPKLLRRRLEQGVASLDRCCNVQTVGRDRWTPHNSSFDFTFCMFSFHDVHMMFDVTHPSVFPSLLTRFLALNWNHCWIIHNKKHKVVVCRHSLLFSFCVCSCF